LEAATGAGSVYIGAKRKIVAACQPVLKPTECSLHRDFFERPNNPLPAVRETLKAHPGSLFRRLMNDGLFDEERAESRRSHRDFDWSEVAQTYLREHLEKKLTFAKKLIESMGRSLSRSSPPI
jgi:hypothetical protein